MADYYAELANDPALARVDGWRHSLEQWLRFEVLRRGLAIDATSSVLDLGCGTGRLFYYLGTCRSGRYVGVDRLSQSVARGRGEADSPHLIHADIYDATVTELGSFDYALAVGALVDGQSHCSKARRQRLARLMARLHELSDRGWALVVLNQQWLEEQPLRRLDPELVGAFRHEIEAILSSMGVEAVIDDQALPSDLFVMFKDTESVPTVARRIEGDQVHEEVIARHRQSEKPVDDAHIAWLWLIADRPERAAPVISELPASHRRKAILEQRLKLLTR